MEKFKKEIMENKGNFYFFPKIFNSDNFLLEFVSLDCFTNMVKVKYIRDNSIFELPLSYMFYNFEY